MNGKGVTDSHYCENSSQHKFNNQRFLFYKHYQCVSVNTGEEIYVLHSFRRGVGEKTMGHISQDRHRVKVPGVIQSVLHISVLQVISGRATINLAPTCSVCGCYYSSIICSNGKRVGNDGRSKAKTIRKMEEFEFNNATDCRSEPHHPPSPTIFSGISWTRTLHEPAQWLKFSGFCHVIPWSPRTILQSLPVLKNSVQWDRQSFSGQA